MNIKTLLSCVGFLSAASVYAEPAQSGLKILDFNWASGKATVTNASESVEYFRPVCSWRTTIDGETWSEGSFDLYQLAPGQSVSAAVPSRKFPPSFAPVGYGKKRMTLVLSDGGRELDRRIFDASGKIQCFPETPARFRFDGDILSKPYLQNAGTTGFTVCLETRREMKDLKLVWTADGSRRETPFAFRRADFSGTFLARARVEGLKPGTAVAYEVAGEKGAFTTWKDDAGDFKCAIFGDFQSGISNGPKWWDWEEDPFLCGEKMFEDIVASGCEFAVNTGDLADTGDYKKELRPLLLERTCGVMGSKIPFFTAFGNHDSLHPSSHFFIDNPVSDPRLSSFAFYHRNCLFICIDDAEVGNDKTPGRPELREWFDRLMNTKEAREAKFRFVFQHVPVYVEAFGNCVRWLFDQYEKYGVDCIFSGDHHGYERIVRGKTRQVVCGCFGYFGHGSADVSGLVNWYGDETLAGGHRGMPRPTTWRFQEPGKPGVLGPATPVYEGLVPGYASLEVKGDTAVWTLHGFNADGSPIGVLDSFEMKSGVRPNAPKGPAVERYCYGQTPKGKWFLKYTLTGKGGKTAVFFEDDVWIKSKPFHDGDTVGIDFFDADGKSRRIRLAPDNTLTETRDKTLSAPICEQVELPPPPSTCGRLGRKGKNFINHKT